MGREVAIQNPRANGLASVRVVEDEIAIFDTARFEHYQRIATVMANSSLVPEHLKGENSQQALSNCFLVVEIADRWGMSPFAVAQASFVYQGKIGFEGKLIAAAIEKKLGFKLSCAFSGNPGTDARSVTLTSPDGRSITGTVKQWQTFEKGGGVKGMWRTQPDDQLIYRGTRQWCRRYEPGVILGIYSDDEIEAIGARRAPKDITPKPAALLDVPQDIPDDDSSDDEADPATPNPEAFLAHLAEEYGACGDAETLKDTRDNYANTVERLSEKDQTAASNLYAEHLKRVGG